jgi:hypothetical protein
VSLRTVRAVASAALLIGSACGTGPATVATTPSPTTPVRTMSIALSGGLSGAFTEVTSPGTGGEGTPICQGRMSSDPSGVSYLLAGRIGREEFYVTFGIHGTQQPGTFTIGPYPDGSPSAPAVVNVVLLRDAFGVWNSGTGRLVVDPGGRSGTLDAELPFNGWAKFPTIDASPPPTTALPALHVSGTWLCPPGT